MSRVQYTTARSPIRKFRTDSVFTVKTSLNLTQPAAARTLTQIETNTTSRGRSHLSIPGNQLYPGLKMATTANSSSVVVCGVLCFIQNKISYVPADKLREVVARGFGEDEVTRAKDLLFESASGMTQFNHIRKKVRKNTGGRKKVEMDVEDILHLCYEADKAKANLPRFAVIDINSFPCIPLEEVDCGAVAEKVVTCLSSELQEAVEKLTKEVECIELRLKDMNKSVSDRPGEVAETYQSYADSVKSGKNPTQVHVEVEEKSTRDLVEKKERSMNVLNNTRLTTY